MAKAKALEKAFFEFCDEVGIHRETSIAKTTSSRPPCGCSKRCYVAERIDYNPAPTIRSFIKDYRPGAPTRA